MARVRGGVRDRLFALLRSVGISASYSICGRFAPARPGQMISRWGCFLSFSLSGRRCRAHWDILSTAPIPTRRKRDTPSKPEAVEMSRMKHNEQTGSHSNRYASPGISLVEFD